MSLFSSKASSPSNRKPEQYLLVEDLKREDQHAYAQSRSLAAQSSSTELREQPHPSSFDPPSYNQTGSTPSMYVTPIEAPHKEQRLRKGSSSARKDTALCSRSDPSSVASCSYGVPLSRRSVSNAERHNPEPPMPLPLRSNTIPTVDSKCTISRISSKSTSKLESTSHNRSILPYVPDFPHLVSQQIPIPHTSPSTKQSPARRPRTCSVPALEDRTVASVDMKRLLSKPALPSGAMTATTSAHSLLQSDSEFSSSGSHTGQSKASTSGLRRPPDRAKPARCGRRDSPLVSPYKGSLSATSPVQVTGMSFPSQLSSSPEDSFPSYRSIPLSLHDQRESPGLKRYPNSRKSLSLSSPTKVAGDHQLASHLTIDPALSRRPGARRREVSKGPPSGSPLTPAGAVAAAYKQQEQKRDYLSFQASGSGDDKTPRIAEWQFSDDDGQQASPGPHYTVFGSPSDRLFSVGDLSDGLLGGYTNDSRYVKPDSGTGHGLKRKVSARWKKATAGIRGDEFAAKNSDLEPGVQGRRSISLPREKTKPFGRSLDMRSPNTYSPGESISSMQHIFTTKVAVNDDMRLRPGKLLKSRGDRDREKDEEGGKIWKLMKRISTGGLRDKYQADSLPPPVPPLPKDIHSADEDYSGVLLQTQSRSSVSAPPTRPCRSNSPRTSAEHGVGSGSVSTSRPNMMAGSSSSPGSSDFASTPYFHQSHSTKSSSSNCEGATTIPNTMIGQHIIPPSELYRMNLEDEQEIKSPLSKSHIPQRSMSLPVRDSLPPPDYWPEYTRPSLPYPPRRAVTSGIQNIPQLDTSSPEVSLVSSEDADKLFAPQNDPHDLTLHIPQSDFGLSPSSPLPRLSATSKRQRLCSLSVSTHSSGFSPSPLMSKTPLSDGSHDNYFEAGNPNQKSLGTVSNASTAGQHPNPANLFWPSSPIGDSSATSKSPARSPLNFRELGASPHTTLTAREKAEIWNDLLERSDRAGGTLHIGGQELMSEHMG